jgi:hypothetical protein
MKRFAWTRLLFAMPVLSLFAAVWITNAASPQNSIKLQSVEGSVMVNGRPGVKGMDIASDSVITTAARSSAVVSLGKLGRVEVLPESSMKLSFNDTSVSLGMLDQGRVRVSSSSGVNATTRDGQVSAKGDKRTEFTVDTTCGNTFVSVAKNTVELRAGNSVKQIAAGGQDTAGTARPGCTPQP